RLTVTAAAGPTLLLLTEVEDLAVAILAEDLGLHLGAIEDRLAHLGRVRPTDHQHLGEGDVGARRAGALLHAEDVALCHPVLLAARANHCVHRLTPVASSRHRGRSRKPNLSLELSSRDLEALGVVPGQGSASPERARGHMGCAGPRQAFADQNLIRTGPLRLPGRRPARGSPILASLPSDGLHSAPP